MRQFALDIETTGLEPSAGHRVIEAGLIEIVDGSITNFHYHQYYNPGRPLDPEVANFVEKTDKFLATCPNFMEEGRSLLNIIDGHELIIHKASFDVGFLNNQIRLTMPNDILLEQRCKITDTLPLARKLHPGQKCNLRALMERYGINMRIYEDVYQGALYDAAAIAEIYLAMITIGNE